MKAPQNVKKIQNDAYNFKALDREFRIEVSEYSDDITGVWVFETDSSSKKSRLNQLKHCLLFRMDWKTEKYEIVMPELGQGDQGNQVGDGRIDRDDCLTPYAFAGMLSIWTKNLLLKNVLV